MPMSHKFELKGTEDKYNEMLQQLENILDNLLEKVSEVYRMTYTDYNFKEQGYIGNYQILR